MNCIISVGRNTANGPLSEVEWEEFKSETLRLALRWGPVVQYGEVIGGWEGETEESFTVTAARYEVEAERPGSRWPIYTGAGRLARTYRQQAVAVTFGRAKMVGPTVKARSAFDRDLDGV